MVKALLQANRRARNTRVNRVALWARAGFRLALHVQSPLLAEEEILGGQSPSRPQVEFDEPEGIPHHGESGRQQVGKESSHPDGIAIKAPSVRLAL